MSRVRLFYLSPGAILVLTLVIAPISSFSESSSENPSPLERQIEWREIHRSQKPLTRYLVSEFQRLRLQFANLSGDIALISEPDSWPKPTDTTAVQTKITSVKAAMLLAESQSRQNFNTAIIGLLLPILALAFLILRPLLSRSKQ